jgi:hypothetical protein
VARVPIWCYFFFFLFLSADPHMRRESVYTPAHAYTLKTARPFPTLLIQQTLSCRTGTQGVARCARATQRCWHRLEKGRSPRTRSLGTCISWDSEQVGSFLITTPEGHIPDSTAEYEERSFR